MSVTFDRTLTLTFARFDRSRRGVTQRATAARSRAYFSNQEQHMIRVARGLLTLRAGVSVMSPLTGIAQTAAKPPISSDAMAVHIRAKRGVAVPPEGVEKARSASVDPVTFNSAQGPGPGPIGPGPGCNLFPAPPSVGATVPLSYFGPSPSEVNQSLVGPVQLLKSGTVDAAHGTITLPLYLGHMKGSKKNVWYILTDVDDPNVAAELGLNFSAKLTFAANAARTANLAADGTLIFDKGTVDFSPVRNIV